MLSHVLRNVFVRIESEAPAESQQLARQLREGLTQEAATHACLRCEKAGWLMNFEAPKAQGQAVNRSAANSNSKVEAGRWNLGLGSCGAMMALPSLPESPGLQTLPCPFYCSAESTQADASNVVNQIPGRGLPGSGVAAGRRATSESHWLEARPQRGREGQGQI